MKFLDLTLPSAAENVALDEALLEEAEESSQPAGHAELLRLWEPTRPLVVIGRSSRASQEVDCEACHELGIPILRRSSGGAAIVAGPGCLMYAVVLSYEKYPQLRVVDQAHRFVLDRIARALDPLLPGVARQGISDLTWRDRKISGNSLRCRRTHLLYHGTLLYQFPLELISRCLRLAPRQPEYRRGRDHDAFVANAPLDPQLARDRLREGWQAVTPYSPWPRQRTESLVRQRYGQTEWNFRLA
jgi:lipoate---protein ligase